MANSDWRPAVRQFMMTNPSYHKMVKTTASALAMANPAGDSDSGDGTNNGEIQKYYATGLNGNVIIVTTKKDETLNEASQTTFQKATVLMTAIMTALASKKKTLYDVDAAAAVIGQCGYFLPLDLQDITSHVDSTTVTLNTALIASIIGEAAAPEAEAALKGVLGTLGGQLTVAVTNKDDTKKIGKLVLWLEEIMGVPLVMFQMYYSLTKEASTVVKSPCVDVAHQTFDLAYHMQGFMFVDPAWIDKFTPEFAANPDYQALIQKLAGFVPAD